MAEGEAQCGDGGCPDPSGAFSAQTDLAKVYRALGHPARLAIIETLAKRTAACCGEIVDCLPLAQSTVSQHLQVLKEAGLVRCAVKGRNCRYFLNTKVLTEAAAASAGFFSEITSQLNVSGDVCCCDSSEEDSTDATKTNVKETPGA